MKRLKVIKQRTMLNLKDNNLKINYSGKCRFKQIKKMLLKQLEF